MKKIVVAIDSMKGCLGSADASGAFADGIRMSCPDVDVVVVPVADGGEGSAVVLASAGSGAISMFSRVTGPCGNPVDAEWWLDKSGNVAYMDMASAAGLTLVSDKNRNPMIATSFGVGQLILDAVSHGVSRIVLGLGGSATVDGGLGACQALGAVFTDSDGNVIPSPAGGGMMGMVAGVDISGIEAALHDVGIYLACDVTNIFTGIDGAARVFGPQKGASPDDVEILERGMENLRHLVWKNVGIDLNEVPGSGAAGGSAGMLMALAGGIIKRGAPLILDTIGFDGIVSDADLVVTGEGSADRQTLMGKIPSEVLSRGMSADVPVCIVCGKVSDIEDLENAGFCRIMDINSDDNIRMSKTPGEDAMNPVTARKRLTAAAESLCDSIKIH